MRGIRDRGKTVFLTTHLMEEAERLCDRVAIIEHGRIIDIDSPNRLVDRHCPQQSVALTTEDPIAAERFRAIPGVDAVICNDKRITIRGRGDDLVTEVIDCPFTSACHTQVSQSDPGDSRCKLVGISDTWTSFMTQSVADGIIFGWTVSASFAP